MRRIMVPVRRYFPNVLRRLRRANFCSVRRIRTSGCVTIMTRSINIRLLRSVTMRRTFMNSTRFYGVTTMITMSITRFVPRKSRFNFRLHTLFCKGILRRLTSNFFLFLIRRIMVIRGILRFLRITRRFINVCGIFICIVRVTSRRFSPRMRIVRDFFTTNLFTRRLVRFTCRTSEITKLR